MKPSVHCEELPCLDISGFYNLLWPGYLNSGICNDWLDISVDGSDHVLPIQLTFQDLPNTL